MENRGANSEIIWSFGEAVMKLAALLAAWALAATSAAAQTPAKEKTILFVGAHMDDSEWGAGGLMFKAVRDGLRVVVIQTVSDWSNWPPTQGREKQVEDGVMRIAKEMGIEKILLGYKYHHVPADLELKTRIARIVADVEPDIAVILSENDYWTDHANTARAAKDGIMFAHGYLGRALKRIPLILSYPTGANQTHDFKPDTFVDTTEVIDRIAWLINEIDSLADGKREYSATLTLQGSRAKGFPKKLELIGAAEQVLASEKNWGAMCGARYAEAFQSIRPVPRELW
ncbi:MAG: PIG-L family deacetylase [Acidobacteria bacterium]|nr:PIG-L family deacetylase [Acidobacteriota bacterium]